MKIFRIVLVLCVLNTFLIAQEKSTTVEGAETPQAEVTKPVNNANVEKMSQDIRNHFTAEKDASLYYLGAGAFTTTLGLYYRNLADGYRPDPLGKKSDYAFNTGISYPLMGVGLFQLATGGFMYFKSDKKARDLEKDLEADPAGFREQELTRMENISYWNNVFKYTEYAMIGGGLIAWYAGNLNEKEYMKGLGIGLFFQGVVMYALDYFSSKRSDDYYKKVRDFNFSFNYIPASKNQNAYTINSLGNNGTSLNEGYYMFTLTYYLK